MRVSKLRLAIAGVAVAAICGAAGAGTALAVQTHMFNANGDLQAARSQLQQAVPDKGGHRDAAIGLITQAINQVNLGIQAGAH